MFANIQTFVDIVESVKDADFAIEAVPKTVNLERQIFQALDGAAPKHATLASNTSNMSITGSASSTKRPKQGVDMHFFNPACLMRLVEVMKRENTNEDTMQLTYDLALKMNKVSVKVEKDSIGFVYNRGNAPTQIWMKLWEESRKQLTVWN